jgi:hypothetical protein
VAILDRGYDTQALYTLLEGRDIRPVIPLRQTPAVKAGKHKPPSCEHGGWTFVGSHTKRGASKWRCPAGECKPASVWLKAGRLHTLIPRGTVGTPVPHPAEGGTPACPDTENRPHLAVCRARWGQ